jgi:amino acid transporter
MTNQAAAGIPRLRRTLTLWDLILYGVIVLQPVAPMSAFGALSDRGRGHVVTAMLIAMVAMLSTAISYGRMAQVYPSAGSAFTYVAREIHSSAGYITGWSMVMDYIVNPLICTIWCAGQAHEFAPGLPVWGWKIFFAVVFTLEPAGDQDFCAREYRHGCGDERSSGSGFRHRDSLHSRSPARRTGILYQAFL